MFSLKDRAGVFEKRHVYHWPDGDPLGSVPVDEGVKRCRVAVHTDPAGRQVISDVAPRHRLPEGWRWAISLPEVFELTLAASPVANCPCELAADETATAVAS